MARKILLIGNSHIGSLKAGFDMLEKKTLNGFDFSFCAVPRNNFYNHNLQDNILDFDKSVRQFRHNLSDQINLEQYDNCVCVFNVSPLSRLMHKRYSFYSEALLRDYIKNFYWLKKEKHDSHELILSVYNLNPQKFIFIGAPLICESKSNNKIWLDEYYYYNQVEIIRKLCQEYFNCLNGPKILLPPKHLLNNTGYLTNKIYLNGGLNADGKLKNDSKNKNHMNASYGKEILIELLSKFK